MDLTGVRVQPSFFKFIPILKRQDGSTILGTIYLRKSIYENLQSKQPKPLYVSYLLHEKEHVKRINKVGKIRFGLRYLCNGKYRFHEELAASKAGWKYMKQHNQPVDLARRAKIMSGYLYLWPVSYEYAKKEIEKAWRNL